MSDDDNPTREDMPAVLEGYLRRAARIGRLAAEEHAPHEEAHRIAAATAVLASTQYGRDAAREKLRRMPLLHAVIAAAVTAPLVTAFLPEGKGLGLFSFITIAYLVVHVAELTVGSPLHRWAARLPLAVRQFVSPRYDLFESMVLSSFRDHSRRAGRVGCTCSGSGAG